MVFGIVAIFVSIPHENVTFGGFATFDFDRLRRAAIGSAVPIAPTILLDIFSVFLLAVRPFGSERD